MSTAVTVKQKTEKQQLSEAKVKMKDKIRAAKEKYRQQKEDLKTARRIGYSSGSYDHGKIPKTKGAKAEAKKGYGKALDDGDKLHNIRNKFYGGRMDEKTTKKANKKN